MKKRYWIPLLVIAILVAIRLVLPFWLTSQINRTLEEIDGFTGSIAGVDLNIIGGQYGVDSLTVFIEEGNDSIPFLYIDQIDLSVEWGSLFQGTLAGDVELSTFQLNFLADMMEFEETGEEVDWPAVFREMMPVRIDRFAILDGTIRYYDYGSDPVVDVSIEDLNLEITNITNVDEAEELPTRIEMSATLLEEGLINLSADADFMQEIPAMDLSLEVEEVPLPSLNNFLKAYAGVDAESGSMFLYSEFAIDEGYMEGYVQPMIYNLQILELPEEDQGVLNTIWEGLVEGVTQIFRFHPDDQFATRVPVSGRVDDAEVGVWPGIWNIFRNAFIDAFEQSLEGLIDFDEVGEE